MHVRHQTPEGAPLFTPDTELAQGFAELGEREGESVLWKGQPSAFTGTVLDETLRKTGMKKVLLVGYMVC